MSLDIDGGGGGGLYWSDACCRSITVIGDAWRIVRCQPIVVVYSFVGWIVGGLRSVCVGSAWFSEWYFHKCLTNYLGNRLKTGV